MKPYLISLIILLNLGLQSCFQTPGTTSQNQCPEQPEVALKSKNVEEVTLNNQTVKKSGTVSQNKSKGYSFKAQKGQKVTYETEQNICVWLYSPENELLDDTTLKKDGKYILQVSAPKGSTTFELAMGLDVAQSSTNSPQPNIARVVGHYQVNNCGSIIDKNTGLEWYIGENRNVTWDEANTWVRNLSVCGGGWRMPTIREIGTIYNPHFTAGNGYYTRGKHWPAHMHPVFEGIGGGSWVWTNEIVGSLNARSFNFNQGLAVEYSRNNTTYSTRVFAVR